MDIRALDSSLTFDIEYTRLKEQLGICDEVIKCRKQLEEETNNLTAVKAEASRLNSEIQPIFDAVTRLQEEIKKETKVYGNTKKHWKTLNNDSTTCKFNVKFLFLADHRKKLSIELLQDMANLSKQTSLLLEQSLRIEKNKELLRTKSQTLSTTRDLFDRRSQVAQEIEDKIAFNQAALTISEQDWSRKRPRHEEHTTRI